MGGKRLVLVVAALAVVVVVIVALVSCFSSGPSVPPLSHDISAVQTNGQVKSYVSSSGEPSQFGIDVSSHNGQIDWQQVANDPDGVQFAYLRAGWRGYDQGIIQEDPQVRANITGATQAGLGVGLYFFSQAITVDEAREEADYVCDLADEFGLSGYPIVFDLEESNVDVERIGHLTTQERTDIALAFCQRVEDRGYEPMIYSNNHWFTQRYDLPRISHAAKLWYARYGDDPGVDYDFAMWQYDNEGAIQGIDTIVDLDIMFPDE